MGWEYALVDAGWNPAWIAQLTAYARERGVRVLLWARWDELTPPSRRDALLRRYRDWGVAGVKLDYMESDSFRRMRWYRTVARAAARRRLLVNFHGSTLPRGMSRTWPNVLTWEGVRGAETYKGPTPVTPEHNAMLPFTRNAVGSMDYTPVTFSAAGRRTSAAHELALSVVFESGLQHLADRPDVYSALAPARRWLRHVPAAWDAHGAARRLSRRLGDDRAPARPQLVRRLDPGRPGRRRAAAAPVPVPRAPLRRADRRGRRRRRAAHALAAGHREAGAAAAASAPTAATSCASSRVKRRR